MSQYKLFYFNGRGRAEAIRLAFALTGTTFEDVRIETSDWPKHKSATPLGQMPYLEVDGKFLSQSGAILRYLGQKLGISGQCDWEKAKADEVTGITDDIIMQLVKLRFHKDDATLEDTKASVKEAITKHLENLEKLLERNGGGYFVGTQATIADLVAFTTLEMVTSSPTVHDAQDKCPLLKANTELIRGDAKIKAWLDARPETPF